MKKIMIVLCLIILIICGIIIFVLGKRFMSNDIKIFRNIEIDTLTCEIEKKEDSHGGFLGDGEYFAKIKCSKIGKLSNNWKKLPLSEQLREIMEMKRCDGRGCMNIYEKYSIPNIKGYYLFLDRHSEAKDKYDDTNINKRSSYNLTLVLLDIETNIMYYYVLDT